jgi:hypothetical protein
VVAIQGKLNNYYSTASKQLRFNEVINQNLCVINVINFKFAVDANSFGGFHLPFVGPSSYSIENQVDSLVESYENKDKTYK